MQFRCVFLVGREPGQRIPTCDRCGSYFVRNLVFLLARDGRATSLPGYLLFLSARGKLSEHFAVHVFANVHFSNQRCQAMQESIQKVSGKNIGMYKHCHILMFAYGNLEHPLTITECRE